MIALYRIFLHAYPAPFRAEYGEELSALFAMRLREHSRAMAPFVLIASAIADIIPNAFAVHLDILRQDVVYAARSLGRAPGFALTAIVIVALGVGANTAAFSLADFVLLRPLPYPDSTRLVRLWQTDRNFSSTNDVSPANFRDWKTMASRSTFRGMAAYSPGAMNLVGVGSPQRLQTARVTPDLLPLIGVPALRGRIITPADAAAGGTAVISDSLWRGLFGADAGVIGRTVRINGAPYTVIGVMPPSFHFPSRDVDVWIPLLLRGEDFEDRDDTYLQVVGRLAAGATVEEARAELVSIAARLHQQYPDGDQETNATLFLLSDPISNRPRLLVLTLCGASLCILLLACANLASLLLARAVSRTRELAVRTALGAGRERLVRQLITESLAIAMIGGAIGVALAVAGVPLLAQLVPSALPIGQVPSVDLRVLVFATALIVITGLGFGIVPALRAGKSRDADALREGGRSGGGQRQRMRSALVVVEVTGCIALLITSGLLMRSIWRIESVDPGFRAENATALRTALPLPKYGATAARERFYRRVLDDVRALPGVESAGYVTGLPMDRRGGIWGITLNGTKVKEFSASVRYITPGFFPALGIPLRKGRDIAESDTGKSPYVAIVSEAFARQQWPDQDPIGRRFGIALSERMVVGVVGDIRVRGLERTSEPQVYLPSGQVEDDSIIGYIPQDLVIRSKMTRSQISVDQWLPAVRRIVAAADPEQPISNVRSVSEIVSDDTAPRRVQLRLLTILSAVALLIAGVGIHGLLSFAVSQRTQELGIRRALGAQAGAIVGMVLREGLRLAVIGVVIGVIVALFVSRGMTALLFGIAPSDPQTILAAVALCLATTLIGCLRPALRAARIDPMTALREG